MNRYVKWFGWIVVALTALMAVAALVWHHDSGKPIPHKQQIQFLGNFSLIFLPFWGGFAMWRLNRHLKARLPNSETDRWRPRTNFLVVFSFGLMLVMQTRMMLVYIDIVHFGAPGAIPFTRLIICVVGAFMAWRGNHLGKIAPVQFKDRPVPDPALWSRYMRLSGWIWVLSGVGFVAAALFMPIQQAGLVYVSGCVLLLITEAVRRSLSKVGWAYWA